MGLQSTKRAIGLFALIGVTVAAEPRALAEQPAVVVRMTDQNRFDPPLVRVKVGQVVLWKNTSVETHSVTDIPQAAISEEEAALPNGAEPFDSGNLGIGDQYSHRFTQPGTYRYFCSLHVETGMVGTVIVTP
jgi:plastocyanin